MDHTSRRATHIKLHTHTHIDTYINTHTYIPPTRTVLPLMSSPSPPHTYVPEKQRTARCTRRSHMSTVLSHPPEHSTCVRQGVRAPTIKPTLQTPAIPCCRGAGGGRGKLATPGAPSATAAAVCHATNNKRTQGSAVGQERGGHLQVGWAKSSSSLLYSLLYAYSIRHAHGHSQQGIRWHGLATYGSGQPCLLAWPRSCCRPAAGTPSTTAAAPFCWGPPSSCSNPRLLCVKRRAQLLGYVK